MFDLDGTLARFEQDEFLQAYFGELSKVFVGFGYDADTAVKGVWSGTKAMVQNDGSMLNTQRFWETFAKIMNIEGEQLKKIETACDSFYSNEFNVVKAVIRHSEIPKRIVREMATRGFCVVLATNPLFPPCAVDSRLGWIELNRHDFEYFTHYENSSYCKPNPGYYNDIFSKIGKSPQQCLMVGNNPAEDMCVSKLGADVFLVTDFMENETGIDINIFKHGTIEDLEAYLLALPAVR
jgi:FMN phosphatase YigB (HAD superfamily)